MKPSRLLECLVFGLLFAGAAAAHDEANDEANDVAPNRRDNIVPFFDAGDPRTRHDSDPNNNEDREDPEVRRERQRWRDEVRGDGSTGEVGDGCMDQYCYVGVSDQNGDYVRFDHTLSVGPASQEGDWNRVRVEALGAGGVIYLGDTEKPLGGNGPGIPDGSGAGVYDPKTGDGSPDEPGGDPDLEPDDPTDREAPTDVYFNHSPDHAWLGLAHSSSQHGDGEFSSHDTHGGTIWADVHLPSEDDPTRVRDSNAGNSIIEHLSCATCTDEYHEVWADPERTIFQVGEAPGQARTVAQNPDRWIFGHQNGQPADRFNAATDDATDGVFGDDNVEGDASDDEASDLWGAAEGASSSATGVGAANSLCCSPDPDQGGHFCNRNPGGTLMGIAANGAIAGCVEVASGDCIGGAVGPDASVAGCAVVGGEIIYDEQIQTGPGAAAECTRRAVEACCAYEESCL